jgi:hypothetical protein
VDTDAKKIERFRDGLDGKLYEWLNLLEPDSFHELVNKAISQEDAMKKAHRDKKRSFGFGSGSGTYKKFCFVKKNVPNPSQQSSTGRWTMKPPQGKPSGNFQFRSAQQQAPKPNAPPRNTVIAAISIVVSQGTTSVIAPSPSRTSPTSRIKVQEASLSLRLRTQWCKSARAS